MISWAKARKLSVEERKEQLRLHEVRGIIFAVIATVITGANTFFTLFINSNESWEVFLRIIGVCAVLLVIALAEFRYARRFKDIP